MNKIFKVKKNALGQSVACSELATSRSKALLVSAVLAVASVGVSAEAVESEWVNPKDINVPKKFNSVEDGTQGTTWVDNQEGFGGIEDLVAQNYQYIEDLHGYLTETNDNVEANREEIANRAEGLQAQITANQADSAKNFADTNAKIQANKEALETKVEKREFNEVRDHVLGKLNDNSNDIAILKANKANVEADIAENKKNIAANKEDINELANTAIANRFNIIHNKVKIHMLETSTLDLTSTKTRVSALENRTSALETRVNKLNKNLSAGIAGTAALSMMPTAGEKGAHYITAGAGHYNGQQAIAIGLTGNSNSGKFNYKVGASATTSGSPVVGAGVGFRWK